MKGLSNPIGVFLNPRNGHVIIVSAYATRKYKCIQMRGVAHMLKVAVIGLGDISNIHIPTIRNNPDVQLVAVCDIDESKSSGIEADFYSDYEEMLEKETLDCVHICLPHHLHYPVVKACVEKGLHVFLEKPLSHNLDTAKKIVQLEAAHPDVKMCICYQNRLNDTFESLYNIVKSGKYGAVTGIKGLVAWHRPQTYYDEKPWRGKMAYAGGGVMINQAIHTLDLMQLIGGEIQSIKGSIDHLSDYGIEVEDTATAKVSFKNGFTGLFFSTVVNANNSSVDFQVTFKKATFTIKDSILTKVDAHGEKTVIIEDQKLPGAKFYYGASHTKLINRFYEAIRTKTNDYIHVKEGLMAMKMIDAIRTSSQKHETITF